MMVYALHVRGVDNVVEFQNMNWETIDRIRLWYCDAHAIKDLKELVKKVKEYCKLIQIFPCSTIASITHNNYKEFLTKYYPTIEEARATTLQSHLQAVLLNQLNGNTEWQDAKACKLAMIDAKIHPGHGRHGEEGLVQDYV